MSSAIQKTGGWFDGLKGYTFHYVGAAANVFFQNQVRLGRAWAFFKSSNIGITIANFAFWLSIPGLTQGLRALSLRKREKIIAEMSEEQLSEEELAQIITAFGDTWMHTWDVMGAIGEGVKMANVFPIMMTLLNVYGGDLTADDGSIKADWVWRTYIAVGLTSASAFFASEYKRNREETDAQLARLCNKIHDAVPKPDEEAQETPAHPITDFFKTKYQPNLTADQRAALLLECYEIAHPDTQKSGMLRPLLGSEE